MIERREMPQTPKPEQQQEGVDQGRRNFMRIAALGAAVVATGGAAELLKRVQQDPKLRENVDKTLKDSGFDYYGSYDLGDDFGSAADHEDYKAESSPNLDQQPQ
ncbi:hypothetical protein HYW59_02610 [Candidatus Kaiserbacteria bacterium]|nr:hypothetical protein [Candidatus Kaiserbacteria bacterium]